MQTMEYYLALKGDELPSHEKTCRNLKHILLSKRHQSKKDIYHMIPTYMTSWKRQNYGDSKRAVVARGWEGRDE